MKKKILLVDDDADILKIVKLSLEKSGFEVIVAHDGDEAVILVKKVKPDLVILDNLMPNMSGFEACARLKQDESFTAPVMIWTGLYGGSCQDIAFGCGADAFLPKPFTFDNLLDEISRLIAPV